jgi:hypothetical protein
MTATAGDPAGPGQLQVAVALDGQQAVRSIRATGLTHRRAALVQALGDARRSGGTPSSSNSRIVRKYIS